MEDCAHNVVITRYHGVDVHHWQCNRCNMRFIPQSDADEMVDKFVKRIETLSNQCRELRNIIVEGG